MAVPAGHGNRQFVDDAQVRHATRDTRHATRDEDEDEDEKWMEFALRVMRLTDRSRK